LTSRVESRTIPRILTFVLTLAVARADPTDLILGPLQGTWHGSHEATIVIHGTYLTLTSDDGYTQFTVRIIPRPDRLRLADEYCTIEQAFRRDGCRLWIGDVVYQRLCLGQAR
jgi:hypothetical protein